jgi:hypothetical protein
MDFSEVKKHAATFGAIVEDPGVNYTWAIGFKSREDAELFCVEIGLRWHVIDVQQTEDGIGVRFRDTGITGWEEAEAADERLLRAAY